MIIYHKDTTILSILLLIMNNGPTNVAPKWGIRIHNVGVKFIMVSSMFHIKSIFSYENKTGFEGQLSMAAFLTIIPIIYL